MRSRLQGVWVLVAFIAGMAIGVFLFSLYYNSARESIQSRSEETESVYYENGGPFPTYPLACPADMAVSDGPTWRTITIGRSSLPNIEDLYGVRFTLDNQPAWIAGDFARFYSVLLTAEAADRWELPGSAALCVVGGKIMVLSISVMGNDPELPSNWISEWVELYGVPEIVTWTATGNDWRWRTVVWPQHGVAVDVDVAAVETHPAAALVDSVTFFPYAQGNDYLASWPYTGLNRQPPTSPNEGYPNSENPFDFEALLPEATEQP